MAESVNTSLDCPICLSRIKTKGVLECMHAFCVTCIAEWRGNKQTQNCPVCKHSFKDILQIKQNGTSKVLQPIRRHTTRVRPHIRPNIPQFSSEWHGGIESMLSNINQSYMDSASLLRSLNSEILRVSEHSMEETDATPQTETNTLTDTGTNIEEQSIIDELFESQLEDAHVSDSAIQGSETVTNTDLVPNEQYFALFFCSCGNSWESTESSFIDEPQSCQVCKRTVIPDY